MISIENNVINAIKQFISNVKDQFDINFYYEYSEREDMYNIYHNYVDFDDPNFKRLLGKNIRIQFFEKDIFNLSIAYSSRKLREVYFTYPIPNKLKIDWNIPSRFVR